MGIENIELTYVVSKYSPHNVPAMLQSTSTAPTTGSKRQRATDNDDAPAPKRRGVELETKAPAGKTAEDAILVDDESPSSAGATVDNAIVVDGEAAAITPAPPVDDAALPAAPPAAPKRRGRPPKAKGTPEPPKRRGRPPKPKGTPEPPKRRGRPPKAKPAVPAPDSIPESVETTVAAAPKRRGRPPKAESSAATPTTAPSPAVSKEDNAAPPPLPTPTTGSQSRKRKGAPVEDEQADTQQPAKRLATIKARQESSAPVASAGNKVS